MSTRPQHALRLVPELSEDDTPTAHLGAIESTKPSKPVLRVIKGGSVVVAALALTLAVAIGMASAFKNGIPAFPTSNDSDPDSPAVTLCCASGYQRRQPPYPTPSYLPRELPIEPPRPAITSPAASPSASITALPWATPEPSPSPNLALVPSPTASAPSSAPMASAPAA